MLPFEDSRRLTGGNLYFPRTGAVLEVIGVEADDGLIAEWRARVERAASSLGWESRQCVARRHTGGVALAIAAPVDQLWVATEINEWALCAALFERDPVRWQNLEGLMIAQSVQAAEGTANPTVNDPPVLDKSAALARFARLSAVESRPELRELLDAARARSLPYALDDSDLTLGAGEGARSFSLQQLPRADEVAWHSVHDIPTVVVTGSNGKTTTVRLLAACAREQGWHTAYNCTDGVFFDSQSLAGGDYSGPAGARMVLREPRAQAAILETARGGILRRGIAMSQAHAAIVTNVSPDHFGEYGIHDLAGLADVKMSVAAAVGTRGLLVLNAEDPVLLQRAAQLPQRLGHTPRLGWFSAASDGNALREFSARGAPVCGPYRGRLRLVEDGTEFDLGAIVDLPLSMSGLALYNIGNMAAAVLAARAMGVEPGNIAAVLARFGAKLDDNPGRLMRFDVRGITVLLDYAHNPDGLRGFLSVAAHLRSAGGRLGVLLGQAGNRQDADIKELAGVAAQFHPDLVVVKEDEAHLRGRSAAEVPRILRGELLRLGLPDEVLPLKSNELEAARFALQWARAGDVLALPIHSSVARASVVDMLQTAQST
jgi:UDP-N-acetylmuramyl tripeptide synthase